MRGRGCRAVSFWVDVLPFINEALMIASAISVSIGWRRIRQGQIAAHRRLMLAGTGFGAAFLIGYLTRSFTVGDTTFGGPEELRAPYLAFLALHIVLATIAGILGVITLRRALRGRFDLHRRIAPATATLWLVAAGTGLVVFLLLYVIYSPGPTVRFY